jgi:hypothetical protein
MLYNYKEIIPQQFDQYHTVLYDLHLVCNSYKANYKLVLHSGKKKSNVTIVV